MNLILARQEQDEFAYHSNMKAVKANADKVFEKQIVPYVSSEVYLDENEKKQTREFEFKVDEGPRADTTM